MKDAFYHLSLPQCLRDYFCLPSIRAKDVGISSLDGRRLKGDERLTPRLAVVPMGWSWALYMCQTIHESLALESGLTEEFRIRDRKPPPDSTCCHTQYVDNMIVMGTNDKAVRDAYCRAVTTLKEAGLQVHEEEVDFGATLLGWEITNGGLFRPARRRAWKVRFAVREMLSRGRSSSHQLEKLIGHCSFLCLGRRECFSVFGAVYKFIRHHYNQSKEFPLWREVREELMIFDGLIPLIQKDLTSPWSSAVHAVDASEGGMGATVAEIPISEVQSVGRSCERWRFRESHRCNPRQDVLEEQYLDQGLFLPGVAEGDDQIEVEKCTPGFSNVPFSFVNREWKTVGKHQWRDRGTLPVFEARSTLYGVKHILRNRQNFGKRHLILSDSLTATCAISRGRSQIYRLRRVCCQIGALALCSNSCFSIRWIPSEWNPADNPSRGVWKPSTPKQFFSQERGPPKHPNAIDVVLGCAGGSFSGDGDFSRHDNVRAHSLEQSEAAGETEKNADCEKRTRGVGASFTDKLDSNKLGGQRVVDRNSFEEEKQENEANPQESNQRLGPEQDSAGGSFSFEGMLGQIQSSLVGSSTLGVQLQRHTEGAQASGPSVSKPFGKEVFGGGRHQHCPIHSGQRSVLQPQSEGTQHAVDASGEIMLERLEETSTGSQPIACALGSGLPFGGVCHEEERGPVRNSHVDDVHHVHEANRGLEGSVRRRGEANWQKRSAIPQLDFCDASFRVGSAIKDSRIRREPRTRPGLSSGGWRHDPSLHHSPWYPSEVDGASTFQQGSHIVHGAGQHPPEFGGAGEDRPLSFQTWWGQSRCSESAPGLECNPDERKVEVPGVGSSISKGCKVEPDLRKPPSRSSKRMPRRRKSHGRHTATAALKPSVQLSLTLPVFIEIFCGCGRLGKAISRQNNWPTLLWDITLGDAYDLRLRHNRYKIAGWLRAGFIGGVILVLLAILFQEPVTEGPGHHHYVQMSLSLACQVFELQIRQRFQKEICS